MIQKVGTSIDKMGVSNILRKTFVRNFQTIETSSASVNGKVYHRFWKIMEHAKPTKIIGMTYDALGNAIPQSKTNFDMLA